MNYIYPDICEIGWSLVLSAHLRWMKKNTDHQIAVMTTKNKLPLYNFVDESFEIPEEFHQKFKGEPSFFGHKKKDMDEIRKYFNTVINAVYTIPAYYAFVQRDIKLVSKRTLFSPYDCANPHKGKCILVFPRHRKGKFGIRNLPEKFYKDLIKYLCKEFPDTLIVSMGVPSGSYSIDISLKNYVNKVSSNNTLQDLIDYCYSCICAIGGTSAPPKLTLLQGVPTYIIGHEKNRMTIYDNWLNTRVGFWEIKKSCYNSFCEEHCIADIGGFIKNGRRI